MVTIEDMAYLLAFAMNAIDDCQYRDYEVKRFVGDTATAQRIIEAALEARADLINPYSLKDWEEKLNDGPWMDE